MSKSPLKEVCGEDQVLHLLPVIPHNPRAVLLDEDDQSILGLYHLAVPPSTDVVACLAKMVPRARSCRLLTEESDPPCSVSRAYDLKTYLWPSSKASFATVTDAKTTTKWLTCGANGRLQVYDTNGAVIRRHHLHLDMKMEGMRSLMRSYVTATYPSTAAGYSIDFVDGQPNSGVSDTIINVRF